MLMVITSILPDPLMLNRQVIRTSTISDDPPSNVYLNHLKQFQEVTDVYLDNLFLFL